MLRSLQNDNSQTLDENNYVIVHEINNRPDVVPPSEDKYRFQKSRQKLIIIITHTSGYKSSCPFIVKIAEFCGFCYCN